MKWHVGSEFSIFTTWFTLPLSRIWRWIRQQQAKRFSRPVSDGFFAVSSSSLQSRHGSLWLLSLPWVEENAGWRCLWWRRSFLSSPGLHQTAVKGWPLPPLWRLGSEALQMHCSSRRICGKVTKSCLSRLMYKEVIRILYFLVKHPSFVYQIEGRLWFTKPRRLVRMHVVVRLVIVWPQKKALKIGSRG